MGPVKNEGQSSNVLQSSVLILFAHPYPHRSRVNRCLIEKVKGVDGVVVNDLYQNYPNFHIDTEYEQALLRAADVVVFHHPIYWYSAPALLHQWQEEVLEYGFAYGKEGDALHGKSLQSVITTGHSATAYSEDGYDGATIAEVLRPFAQLARHCGMHYCKPWALHGADKLTAKEIEEGAEAYSDLIQRLRVEGSGG
ncbi:MAG: NAD(P)H-dependent oxidoreductase [Candidatus Sedimenticola sp. (ex Thyasira tokunagai)]